MRALFLSFWISVFFDAARDYNNMWNVNANGNFDNNNFWNDEAIGVRPAFHKTVDCVISICSEKI